MHVPGLQHSTWHKRMAPDAVPSTGVIAAWAQCQCLEAIDFRLQGRTVQLIRQVVHDVSGYSMQSSLAGRPCQLNTVRWQAKGYDQGTLQTLPEVSAKDGGRAMRFGHAAAHIWAL